ncbi:serine O-acetyltransferase EpsC [Dechloromonas hortensis]|uniref:serine O-acetyltransferase EpsC n=1 Tax=Dechloromonas hortensis TaxID=337779 RepID=UPI001292893C|nr:serine O-acetyltransferase EpsC [Dechloromonas hortensis]
MRHPVANSSLAYEQVGGWGVKGIVAELHAARDRWRAAQQRSLEFAVREFPSREALKEIAESLCGALFPMRLGPPDLHQEGEDYYVGHTLDTALNALFQQVELELGYNRRLQCEEKNDVETQAAEIVKAFAQQLPALRGLLDADVEAAYQGDPAARSVDEVLLCYPGILAVIHYRLAHALYTLGVPLVARIIAEIAHSATGIDIHPGARIGPGFFIDHGTGVVIGETTIIGRNVRLYQAVTLGAKRFTQDESGALEKGAPRHPILEDEVVVYAGATILGRITIGRGSSIGGNVWLTRSVPTGSHVSQASLQHEPGGAGRIRQ